MSDDVARLRIVVDSLSSEVARLRLAQLTNQSKKSETAVSGLTKKFVGFAAAAVSVGSAIQGLRALNDVAVRFQNMEARLVTATGSLENMNVAMGALQSFAKETPYTLEESINGFLRLTNLGLDPSERSLMSFGNTAAAMGKSMDQMVEAVADAATFEFERLKEFGIKAKTNADNIVFTFRGVATEVGRNADDITEYLTALGENEFAGEMARRMDTIGGSMAIMGNEWLLLKNSIASAGVSEYMQGTFDAIGEGMSQLNDMFASGEIADRIDIEIDRWKAAFSSYQNYMTKLGAMWDKLPKEWTKPVADAIDAIVVIFTYLPEHISYMYEKIILEWNYGWDIIKAYTTTALTKLVGLFEYETKKLAIHAANMANAMNPFSDDYDLEGELAKAALEYNQLKISLIGNVEDIIAARGRERTALDAELQTAKDSYDTKVAASKALTTQYQAEAAARRATEGDVLAQFKTGGEGSTDSKTDTAAIRAAAAARKAREKAFQQLQDSLRSEEEVLRDSYKRRLEIILINTKENSDARSNLTKKLNEKFMGEVMEREINEYDFAARIEKEREFWEQRKDLISEMVGITEQERTDLETSMAEQRNAAIAALEYERNQLILQGGASLFGNLADLTAQFAGDQSAAYKVMFAASKAFAIADAVVKIQQGIAAASTGAPWPANLGAMASVVAATGSIVSTIAGTNMKMYDKGGFIPAGAKGIVGEYGPEVVSGPAQVTGREDTMAMLKQALAGKAKTTEGNESVLQPQTNLRIINNIDPEVFGEYMGSAQGEKVILNLLKKNTTTIKRMVS